MRHPDLYKQLAPVEFYDDIRPHFPHDVHFNIRPSPRPTIALRRWWFFPRTRGAITAAPPPAICFAARCSVVSPALSQSASTLWAKWCARTRPFFATSAFPHFAQTQLQASPDGTSSMLMQRPSRDAYAELIFHHPHWSILSSIGSLSKCEATLGKHRAHVTTARPSPSRCWRSDHRTATAFQSSL